MRIRLTWPIGVLLLLAAACPVAAAPATRPAAATAEERKATEQARREAERVAQAAERERWAREQKQLTDDLAGADDAKAAAAVKRVEELAAADWNNKSWPLEMLLKAKRYAEADAVAVDLIARFPGDTRTVASLQKLRVQALLGEDKPDQALSAAKAYYDVAPLAWTTDAINQVALCLARAKPQEKGIVRRFKRQQVAGAATRPAAQPDAELGEPVLPSIEVDGKPLEAAIAGVKLNDYERYVAKGNLLLAAGRAKEAREVFEQAYDLADGKEVGPAIENVARAIRAESGCVGPANAYILSLRDKPQ